jgi:hypothetical protein
MAEAPAEKKTRVRRTTAETITEQAKKLTLAELIAHYKACHAEIISRQNEITEQLALANSI